MSHDFRRTGRVNMLFHIHQGQELLSVSVKQRCSENEL